MQHKIWLILGSMSIISGTVGCEATGGAGPISNATSLNPSLVMPTPLMMEMALVEGSGGDDPQMRWEAGRNDSPFRATGGLPDYPDYFDVQFNLRERLRVSNGRPRENSTFSTLIHGHRLRR